jgi:hypothetical protein
MPIISDPVTGFVIDKLCRRFLRVRIDTFIVLVIYTEMVKVSRVRHVYFISTQEWPFVQCSVLIPVRERMNPILDLLKFCRHDLVLFMSSEMRVVTLFNKANHTSLETQRIVLT